VLTEFILPGIGFALSAVTVPGPLTAYLLHVTLRGGWRRGLYVIVSPLVVDIPIILMALLILNQLQAVVPVAIRLIQVAGGLLLLWIARGAWQQYRAGAQPGAGAAAVGVKVGVGVEAGPMDDAPRHIFRRALLMNVLSPGPYLFWSTVNGPLLLRALAVSPLHAAGFLVAFYGTFLGGLLLLSLLFDRLGHLNPRFTRGLLLATVVLLLLFGGRLIVQGLTG
jgi:threonine/homoserine/homoserine lactone efflux protein